MIKTKRLFALGKEPFFVFSHILKRR